MHLSSLSRFCYNCVTCTCSSKTLHNICTMLTFSFFTSLSLSPPLLQITSYHCNYRFPFPCLTKIQNSNNLIHPVLPLCVRNCFTVARRQSASKASTAASEPSQPESGWQANFRQSPRRLRLRLAKPPGTGKVRRF